MLLLLGFLFAFYRILNQKSHQFFKPSPPSLTSPAGASVKSTPRRWSHHCRNPIPVSVNLRCASLKTKKTLFQKWEIAQALFSFFTIKLRLYLPLQGLWKYDLTSQTKVRGGVRGASWFCHGFKDELFVTVCLRSMFINHQYMYINLFIFYWTCSSVNVSVCKSNS